MFRCWYLHLPTAVFFWFCYTTVLKTAHSEFVYFSSVWILQQGCWFKTLQNSVHVQKALFLQFIWQKKKVSGILIIVFFSEQWQYIHTVSAQLSLQNQLLVMNNKRLLLFSVLCMCVWMYDCVFACLCPHLKGFKHQAPQGRELKSTRDPNRNLPLRKIFTLLWFQIRLSSVCAGRKHCISSQRLGSNLPSTIWNEPSLFYLKERRFALAWYSRLHWALDWCVWVDSCG